MGAIGKLTGLNKEDILNIKETLKKSSEALHLLLLALLIWLFGNLVFIPIAHSLNWQAILIVNLIIFSVFTFLVVKIFSPIKKMVDVFSVVLACKFFMKKGLNYFESIMASKQVLYLVCVVALYFFYFPFLINFHPAINGLALIAVVIWIFFCILKILRAVSKCINAWLFS